MFDSPCDLAALVYDKDQDPDALLHGFAAALNAQGLRAVGLVQFGHRARDVPELTAVMLHSGAQVRLFQDLGPGASGCKLDVGQLLEAGAEVAAAINDGADLVIINRFGKQEREGKGLAYLIERALSRDIPVVIAVPAHRFDDWIGFAGGMSVTLACDRAALEGWWTKLSRRGGTAPAPVRQTFGETLK
jgi:hypothetical protein